MKSTEFLRDVILSKIQKSHDHWNQSSKDKLPFVGIPPQPNRIFMGQNFDDVSALYRDKIVAASAAGAIQQKGYEFRLTDPSYGEGKERIYRFFVVSIGKKRRRDAFYQDAVYKFFLWISVLMGFAPEECSREMNVYLYLLPDLKELPTEKHQALSQENVNTAFTRTCSHVSEINIYREEEWFKVFIHETFHNNGLDFSLHFNQYDAAVQSELKRCFPALQSQVKLYESYCEFWAETLHSLYVAFFQSTTKRPPVGGGGTRKMTRPVRIWTRAQKIFREEYEFSLLQCVKVLDHYRLTYEDLIQQPKDGSATFMDKNTNSFAYYVIKCIMVHCDFLDWHLAVNGPTLRFSDKNILGLCRWLHTKRHCMLPAIKRMERVYKQMPKTSKTSKTLRMVKH